MFKLDREPFSFLKIREIEERRHSDIFREDYEKLYAACLRTIMRNDLTLSRKMLIYGAQVRALLEMRQ